ncbi:filamentous hemagglutinin N-terminal domain-containing protein [Steroidobacter flavus]|uniref:Filamentous hemagglutinin N-terminal domain-containing protein n=1 Tax=Steroidobacter flavus TaxID=1842136 RepID=A0ABV8T0L9_9GAMM
MSKRPAANQLLPHLIRKRCRGALPVATLLGLGTITTALADPTGGIVVSGQGTISNPAAGTTMIDQSSQQLQLNWDTFNVGANEQVRFNQPSSSATAINRILDQNPSQIFGRIDANGRVVLVNPNGMLFGATAQLNVGSLVASSLDVTGIDADGRFTFGTSRAVTGAIINDGTINAAAGGSVTLLGGRVANNGSIVANYGTVNLVAGRAATLDLAGDGLLQLQVGADLLANESGSNDAVSNGGSLQANGGQVLLSAQALEGVFANLVNNTGVVRANRIENVGGTIRIVGDGGTVRSSGTLDASSETGTGGRVEVLGDRVGLSGDALVDVSGATGGGTALIGGDFQGKNADVINASRTYVGADARIDASAGTSGDGGRVIVWSDELTRFDGHIDARGGTSSGTGGFAEVSGKENLVFTGTADLRAAHGTSGTLLLDPLNITIDASSASAGPASDGNYLFSEDPGVSATLGNATIQNLLNSGSVLLQATNSITQNAGANIDVSGSALALGNSLTLEAAVITLNGNIALNGGSVNLTATSTAFDPFGSALSLNGIIDAADVTATTTSQGNIRMGAGSRIDASGTVSLQSAREITVTSIATPGAVSLVSAYQILDDVDDTTRIVADSLSIATSNDAVGFTSALDTTVNSLTVDGAFATFVDESDGLLFESSDVPFQLTLRSATGDIRLGAVGGFGGELNLEAAAGSILDDNVDATRVGANNLNLIAAGSIGTASRALQLSSTAVSATTTNGGIYLNNSRSAAYTSLIAQGAGSDIEITTTVANGFTILGTLTAADDVNVQSTVSILDDDNDATLITADHLTLSSSTEIGGNLNATDAIDTRVNSLSATTSGAAFGNIVIKESDGLTLTNISAAGFNPAISVVSTTGDITVGSVSVVSSAPIFSQSSVALTALAGAILDDANQATRIVAGTASLSATGNVGSGAYDRIDTTVGSLSATSSSASIYITESDGATLSSLSAVNGEIFLATDTGDLVVGSVAANSDVTLIALGGSIFDDDNNGTRIASDTLTLAAISVGTATASGQIDTGVNSLELLRTSGGNAYLGDIDNLSLTEIDINGTEAIITSANGNLTAGDIFASNGLSLVATNGSIVDDGNAGTRITANTLNLSAGGTIGIGPGATVATTVGSLSATSTNGDVYITEANDITLTSVVAGAPTRDVQITSTAGSIVAGTVTASRTVTLVASNGSILDDGNNTTRITGNQASLQASGNIGAAGVTGQIDTDVANATLTGSGNIYLGEIDGFTLTLDSTANTGSDVEIASLGGDISLGTVYATGDDLSIAATQGSIIRTNPNPLRASRLWLQAGDSIGANSGSGAVRIDTPELHATAGDSIYVDANGNTTLANLSAANDIYAFGTGSFTLGSLAAGNYIRLQSQGNLLDDGDDATWVAAPTLILSCQSPCTAVGTAGVGAIDIDVDSVEADTSGSIFLHERDGLSLLTGGGSVNVVSDSGDIHIDNLSNDLVLQDVRASGANSNVIVTAQNSIVVGSVSAGGEVRLTATTGSIFDDLNDTTRIAADSANLTAQHYVGLNAPNAEIDTDVANLRVSAADGLYLTEQDDLTLETVSVTNGSAYVSVGGDLTVGQVAVLSDVTLDALSGGIADDDDDATAIVGNSIFLNAATYAGTVTDFGAVADADVGSSLEVSALSSLNVHVANDDGQINLSFSTPVLPLSAGAITLGSGVGVTGEIVLQSASDLNLSGLAAGSIGIGIANRASVGLRSGGVLTLPSVLNLTDQAATFLLVRGAVDIVDADAQPRELSFIGEVVDFRSGSLGGATTLNTDVGLLHASLNNDRNLFVNEIGSLQLGAIDVGNGELTVMATGGVNDDNSSTTRIVANNANVTGMSIGAAWALNTQVNSLTVSASNGDIAIRESDSLHLTANATGGAVSVETQSGDLTVASATGTAVQLSAGGTNSDIVLNGLVDATAGEVGLYASGAIVAGTAGEVRGTTLTAAASAIGTSSARLATNVISLNATATGGIFITEADALNLTAHAAGPLDVRTQDGSINVYQASGNDIALAAGGAGSSITLNGIVDAGAGNVTLIAGTDEAPGAITGAPNHRISGNSLALIGASLGAANARLTTQVNSLTAFARTGDMFVTEQDGVTLTSVSARNVDVNSATGDIDVITVEAANDVALTASSGAIDDDGNDTTLITGAGLTLTARSIGAPSTLTGTTLDSSLRLDADVATLDATASTGGIFIDQRNGLQSVRALASGNIELLTQAGDLHLREVRSGNRLLLAAGRDIVAASGATVVANMAELRAGTTDVAGGRIGSHEQPLRLQLAAGDNLSIFVPQALAAHGSDQSPLQTEQGVLSALGTFASPNTLAAHAGFGQFQGLTTLTTDAETQLRTLQGQASRVVTTVGFDFESLDQEAQLFQTMSPAMCLPLELRDQQGC